MSLKKRQTVCMNFTLTLKSSMGQRMKSTRSSSGSVGIFTRMSCQETRSTTMPGLTYLPCKKALKTSPKPERFMSLRWNSFLLHKKRDSGGDTFTYGWIMQCLSSKLQRRCKKQVAFMRELSSWFHTKSSHSVRYGSSTLSSVFVAMTSRRRGRFSAGRLVFSQRRRCSRLTLSWRSKCANWTECDRSMRSTARSWPFCRCHGLSSHRLSWTCKRRTDADRFYRWPSSWMCRGFQMRMSLSNRLRWKWSRLRNE